MELITFPNLVAATGIESEPWAFEGDVAQLRAMPKKARRAHTYLPSCQWSCYSAVRGVYATKRINEGNPVAALRAFVLDYDAVTPTDAIPGMMADLPDELSPAFVETTLSGKVRLVWTFERELLVRDSAHASALISAFVEDNKLDTLLAGYDASSVKPAQLWTNGGVWASFGQPLTTTTLFGIAAKASRKMTTGGIILPLEMLKDEIEKRWPGRWKGDFILDAQGVRFWCPKADNPTGCQVKPDGMLCFTGPDPWRSWADIFGAQWVQQQRGQSFAQAAEGMYFDGREYWQELGGRWLPSNRTDAILRLKSKGLSDKAPKGQTCSDAETALLAVQEGNRVLGAAPLINYASGPVETPRGRILNISQSRPLAAGPFIADGSPEKEFPWLWKFVQRHFARPELRPLDTFLAWTQRYRLALIRHERAMGQAIFICGPRENGKTLLLKRVLEPLFGSVPAANPYDYFIGATTFNDELFSAPLLAINDEEAPRNEADRNKFTTRMKAFVVNPTHTYHPKFCARVQIDFVSRLAATLNDDPASVGLLPEVNSNTMDKMMFFASQHFGEVWPDSRVIEATLAEELPRFAQWLDTVFVPAPEVLGGGRCGVISYFDPVVLEMAKRLNTSSNLAELLTLWGMTDADFVNPDAPKIWRGTPSQLFARISNYDSLAILCREWTVQKVTKALTALARLTDSGVTWESGPGREFSIDLNKLKK